MEENEIIYLNRWFLFLVVYYVTMVPIISFMISSARVYNRFTLFLCHVLSERFWMTIVLLLLYASYVVVYQIFLHLRSFCQFTLVGTQSHFLFCLIISILILFFRNTIQVLKYGQFSPSLAINYCMAYPHVLYIWCKMYLFHRSLARRLMFIGTIVALADLLYFSKTYVFFLFYSACILLRINPALLLLCSLSL
jgi:hypothetical protein